MSPHPYPVSLDRILALFYLLKVDKLFDFDSQSNKMVSGINKLNQEPGITRIV